MLDGDWVWEEDILNAAKALHPNSPFTRQPFAERPHDFANAVIRWLATFNLAPNQNDVEPDAAPIYLDAASLQIDESLSPQLADTMRRYQIATLEQRASLRINQRTSQANEERRRQLDQREAQLIPVMLERIQAAVAHAKQHATVMEQSLRRQVNNYNQTQNDALQTNNQAIAQILQVLEKNQDTIQALIKEIARLNEANITLQNQLATNAEAHQTQIETLTTQVGALQQQVVCLESSLRRVSEEHRSHVHIIDRGHYMIELNGFGPRITPTTVNDYPTKVTEGPLPKDRLYDTDSILYPNDYNRRKYGIETKNDDNGCKTQ